MNVLYITSYCDAKDGVSSAVFSQYEMDEKFVGEQMIIYKWKDCIPDYYNAVSSNNKETIRDFVNKGPLLIHYFRGIPSNILKQVLKIVGQENPIIMTVCQSPFFKPLLLSPFEIRTAWKIVFIDKTSYTCSLLDFLPIEKKTMTYLSSDLYIKETETLRRPQNSPYIIYGRGSTIAKCPHNMFEVFDKINILNKKFVIVGIPDGNNWVRKEAAKRDNVEVYGMLSQNEWFKMCASFDIFLYHLPLSSYASVDGNLGLAMLMRKPVVYMGSDAPKERFVHGENGYVADSIEDMAMYATALGQDRELRYTIGENARKSTIKDFNGRERMKVYKNIYETVTKNIHSPIPLSYYIFYLRYCFKEVLKSSMNYYRRHPGV